MKYLREKKNVNNYNPIGKYGLSVINCTAIVLLCMYISIKLHAILICLILPIFKKKPIIQ